MTFEEDALTEEEIESIPAKNQVTVFGYACDQTPELMPLPIMLAHSLARQLSRIRKSKQLPYLMPDGKVQVGVDFQDRKPVRIHSITITASQKDAGEPSMEKLGRDIREFRHRAGMRGKHLVSGFQHADLHQSRRPFHGRPHQPFGPDRQKGGDRYVRRVHSPQRQGAQRKGPD